MLAEGASFRTIKHKLGTTAPTIVRWKELAESFTSVNDLARKLRRYINAYSANAKPIQWRYSDPNRRIRSNVVSATCH